MDRKQLIQKYFQYSSQLTWSDDRYRSHVSSLFDWIAEGDRVENDPTGELLSLDADVTAVVVSKQKGIVAGVEEVIGLLSRQKSITINSALHDGNNIQPKDEIVMLHGPAAAIVSVERVILSILGRMSGIATFTRHYESLLSGLSDRPAIAATRKTPWMLLDKKAVAVGGGLTHRLDLRVPMVKDNHLIAVGKAQQFVSQEACIHFAVQRLASSERPFFEIEVNTAEQAQAALSAFAQEKKSRGGTSVLAIMLDNMNPASAGAFVKSLRDYPFSAEILVEASGEITEENIRDWATTGVDVVSVGTLTHSAQVANISLDIV